MTRRVITNFRAKDFRHGSDEPAESRPRTDDELAAESAADREAYESEPVPEGTTAEIMDWVGDDADRAQRALDAENENDKPRKTLVSQLENMILKDGDQE